MSDTPQFGTADYQHVSGGHHCKTCSQAITGQYFRIHSAMTCPACAQKTGGQLPTSRRGSFSRGLLFAVVGAVLGMALYSAFGIATGLEIGYVSVAVGYIVGRAMLMGTAGVGGRRHQIAGALLTYVAVSMSAVPISLWQMAHEDNAAIVDMEDPVVAEAASDEVVQEEHAGGFGGSYVEATVFLTAVGLVSPFLGMSRPVSGLIGLVILFVGLRIAWSMTRGNGVEIEGPYHC